MNKRIVNQKNYSRFYTKKIEQSLKASEEGSRLIKLKLSEISFEKEKKVLDVACGVSTLGKEYGGKVFAIDSDKQAVKFARQNGINAKLGDVEKKFNYPDNYFDIVIASNIIEHLVNTDHLIIECRRVLKKGGILIIVTPNLAGWVNRGLLFFGYQPFFTEVSTVDKTLGMKFTRKFTSFKDTVGHLRLFTKGALKDILELYELSDIKIKGLEFIFYPMPISYIDKIISKNSSLASCLIATGRKK